MPRPSVEDERKVQIMAATRWVMVSRGLTDLRIADVAKKAGLSPGIVHYYFDTKEELIRETFEENFRDSVRRRVEVFERDLPPVEKLDALIESYLPLDAATIEAWHVWMELWAGALQDATLREINTRAYGQWRTIVSGIIAEGRDQGDFASSSPLDDANQLVSMIDGLAVQVLLESDAITGAEMHRICRRFVAEHLLARAP